MFFISIKYKYIFVQGKHDNLPHLLLAISIGGKVVTGLLLDFSILETSHRALAHITVLLKNYANLAYWTTVIKACITVWNVWLLFSYVHLNSYTRTLNVYRVYLWNNWNIKFKLTKYFSKLLLKNKNIQNIV